MALTLSQKFYRSIQKAEPDECWHWTKHRDRWGYGRCVTLDGGRRSWLGHRLSWTVHNGPIPEGMCVLHRCDTPSCCNPAHLFLGTVADNNADAAAKGRATAPRGEANHNARLTETQVRAIRVMKARGMTSAAIARLYGVSGTTISGVLTGRTWSHMDKEAA